MNPDTIGWLVIAAVIIAPVVGLVWLTRTRTTQPPAVSAEADLDLHCDSVPGLVDRRPSWDGGGDR